MKQALAIVLAVAFLSLTAEKLFIYTVYQLNKDFIIENYCVNKDKPEMECDGKCHLAKMYKKQKKEQEEFPVQELTNRLIEYVQPEQIECNKIEVLLSSAGQKSYSEDLHPHIFAHSIFHPPQV